MLILAPIPSSNSNLSRPRVSSLPTPGKPHSHFSSSAKTRFNGCQDHCLYSMFETQCLTEQILSVNALLDHESGLSCWLYVSLLHHATLDNLQGH